jgi:hypothetical protein
VVLTAEQITEIKESITQALAKVYECDISLIERRAHERSIAFRFGLYFSQIIAQTSFGTDADLTIDFDYNRNLEHVKNMEGFHPVFGVMPDVILHHRGFNDKNVVVIEFKGYWSGNGRDDAKLRGFTHQELNDYHYGLGVFVRLNRTLDVCELIYYRNGELE